MEVHIITMVIWECPRLILRLFPPPVFSMQVQRGKDWESEFFFFFGRTFDLVSQRSINYACVVKVRHIPNARAYVAVIYMHTPTPNPNNTHKFQHSIGTKYNSNMQPVQARYIPNTL